MARKENTLKIINQNNQPQKLKQESIKHNQAKNPTRNLKQKTRIKHMYNYKFFQEPLEKVLRPGLG